MKSNTQRMKIINFPRAFLHRKLYVYMYLYWKYNFKGQYIFYISLKIMLPFITYTLSSTQHPRESIKQFSFCLYYRQASIQTYSFLSSSKETFTEKKKKKSLLRVNMILTCIIFSALSPPQSSNSEVEKHPFQPWSKNYVDIFTSYLPIDEVLC